MCVLHLEKGVPELVQAESPCPDAFAEELDSLFCEGRTSLSQLALKGHCLLQVD